MSLNFSIHLSLSLGASSPESNAYTQTATAQLILLF